MTFNKSLNQRMSCAPHTSGETRSISELFIIPVQLITVITSSRWGRVH